jgi:Domain of unknown function (DUF4105)
LGLTQRVVDRAGLGLALPLALGVALLAPHELAAAAPRIALYTVGPGDDLFSKFGHAALCVVGEGLPGGGTCYNYGTSDFSRPIALGWEVVRGRAEFWVSVSDLREMLLWFEGEDRTIYRQVLPLDADQVMDVSRRLYRDGAPENRVYVYNHFLDNCSTRPRDHIDRAIHGALRSVRLQHRETFRDYALEGLSSASLALVPASDFIIGRWADRKIDAYQAMFIPDVLRDGVEKALGVAPEIVYERTRPLPRASVASGRAVTWAAFVLVVLAVGAAGRFLQSSWPRRVTGLVLGGLGLVLLFAAVVSALPELQRNELLVVFFPLDFVLLSPNRTFVRSYSTMRLGALGVVGLLKLLGVLLQPLWPFWLLSAGLVGAVRASREAREYTPPS